MIPRVQERRVKMASSSTPIEIVLRSEPEELRERRGTLRLKAFPFWGRRAPLGALDRRRGMLGGRPCRHPGGRRRQMPARDGRLRRPGRVRAQLERPGFRPGCPITAPMPRKVPRSHMRIRAHIRSCAYAHVHNGTHTHRHTCIHAHRHTRTRTYNRKRARAPIGLPSRWAPCFSNRFQFLCLSLCIRGITT